MLHQDICVYCCVFASLNVNLTPCRLMAWLHMVWSSWLPYSWLYLRVFPLTSSNRPCTFRKKLQIPMQPMQELLRNSYYGKESASGNSWNRLKRRGRKCEQRELSSTNNLIKITHRQFIIFTENYHPILCIIAKTVTEKEGTPQDK